jgi:CubicO group peptidase (beta-lactamase class C family)
LFAGEVNDTGALAKAITWRDLLTMTSSRDCDDNNDTPGNEENMYPQHSWTRFFWSLPDAAGWARDGTGLGSWRYCTAGSFILGQALQRATGEGVDDYVARRLFAPLGIARAQWDKSPSGEIQTGGGLELTLADLGKLATLIQDRGQWRGLAVLPAAWIDEMTTTRRDAFFDMRYGYQMWTRDYQTSCGAMTAWFMAGNGGNQIATFREQKLVVAVTRQAYNTRNMHQQTFAMIDHVLASAACPK